MKNKVILIFLLVIASGLSLNAQKMVLTSKSIEISNSQIQKVSKGAKSMFIIDAKSLKTGQNHIVLNRENILFIDYRNNKISKLTLKNTQGRVKGSLLGNKLNTNFQCDGPFCQCKGDIDCNDMFSSVDCGNAVCIEETGICVCFRWG